MNKSVVMGRIVLALTVMSLIACASKEPGFYRHSPVIKQLEVPPDLTSPDFQDSFEVPQIAQLLSKEPLLSDGSKVRLLRDGRLRWLEINAEPTLVWEYMKDFWNDRKLGLEWQNMKLGLMETEWQDNYDSDFALDRFRMRIEPGATAGTTWVFVTHRGVQRELDGGSLRPVWIDRPGDPELEAEVLSMVLDFLSLEPKRKQEIEEELRRKKPESTLAFEESPPSLVVHTDFNRAWQLVALAADRMGHIIGSRNKSAGEMVLRISDAEQGIADLFGKRETMNLKFTEMSENDTRIVVRTDDGTSEDSQEARNFLIRLKESL